MKPTQKEADQASTIRVDHSAILIVLNARILA